MVPTNSPCFGVPLEPEHSEPNLELGTWHPEPYPTQVSSGSYVCWGGDRLAGLRRDGVTVYFRTTWMSRRVSPVTTAFATPIQPASPWPGWSGRPYPRLANKTSVLPAATP